MSRVAKCGVSFKAPDGQYRVIGCDTFDNDDWHVGDYDTLEEAKAVADKKGGVMTIIHVYDDDGYHCHKAGTY